ncbi:MAG: UDP-N-acetylmuramate--L-alanine ligase [Candidatus Omnitrophica bacterium]|nr:UDP-N-acetylmuramate--L-alanine ligase [Candidatus Omnitrophota bacterium]
MFKKQKHIHFIGIGGIGMSGLAWLCFKQGHKITGSDVKPNRITKKLEAEGAQIFIGHTKENLSAPDMVVYSSAVTFQNPELRTAVYSGIPSWPRGAFLSELMKGKIGIAVSGAHGKTTTSSLATTMLFELGYDPTSVIGAIIDRFNGNALMGKGKYFVAEADESDGSFLALSPKYAVITNIDAEHLDFYNSIEDICSAYLQFANKVTDGGAVICCGDDERIKKITPQIKSRMLTYGFSPANMLRADKIKLDNMTSEFTCTYNKHTLGSVKLNIPGEHNILNALAVILIGMDIGLDFNKIAESLSKYRGAERRFQVKADINDILIIDDYAHHPTEIRATLKACRVLDRKRIIAVFQPHRYTRTKFLKKEFATAFVNVDTLILTDIYAASEQPIFGVTSQIIYDEIVNMHRKNVLYIPKKEEICGHLMGIVQKGDLVIILGAGDINRLADELIEKLNAVQPVIR